MIGFDDIEYASLSDVGIRRSHNQDAYATLAATDSAQWKQRGHVFLVADGMGAHAVGELASKIAVDTVPHVYSKYSSDGPVSSLRKAFTEANLTIHTRGQQNREFEGMGTTGTALLLRPEGAWVAHVGDSRAYRVRGNKIEQMTFDHSLIWEVARRQRKSPEEILAQGLPSNVIIRSLGPEPLVQVDVDGPFPVQGGDYYLLCSDGLSGQVTDREIGAVLQSLPPQEAARFLVHLANLQGGPDNITVIVVHVVGAPAEVTEEPAPKPTARFDWRYWARNAPWPLALLLLGILLAGLAILFASEGVSGEVPTFLLAALFLVGGLGGLIAQNYMEAYKPAGALPKQPPKVHRSIDCTINAALCQRMEQAFVALEERIRERNWEADWHAAHEAIRQAKTHLDDSDHVAAFRAQCRALLGLMDAVAQQRQREEAFKPLWDRAAV